MPSKINSTAFKGTILVKAGSNLRTDGNRAHIFNVIPVSIDADKIIGISQHEKYGYTTISTFDTNLEKDNLQFYHVPTWFTSTSDILAAYGAAKGNNMHVELEDKSIKLLV